MRRGLPFEESVDVIREARVFVDDIIEEFLVFVELEFEVAAVAEVYLVLKAVNVEALVEGGLKVSEEMVDLS